MVGLAIKELREAQELTQRELAELTVNDQGKALSHVAISRYERGERQPSFKILKRIAAALGTTVQELRRRGEELAIEAAAEDAEDRAEQPVPEQSHAFVQSWEAVRRWSKRVAFEPMDPDVKLVLGLLSVHIDPETWIVPVTVGRFTAETHLGRELVERAWPMVLESPWLDRIGDVEYVFRLKFPDN